MSDGVPVRGTCKNGHTLSTVAPKGRVTWRGPCPTAGCDLSLIASRIKTTARTDDPAPTPAPAKARSYRVVKGYRDEPRPEFDQTDDGPGPAGGPPGLPADPPDVDDDPGPPPGRSDDDGPDDEPPRRGRLLRRRPGGPRVAPPGLGDDYRVIPGVY